MGESPKFSNAWGEESGSKFVQFWNEAGILIQKTFVTKFTNTPTKKAFLPNFPFPN